MRQRFSPPTRQRVKRGQVVRIRLTVRRYRGSLRTISFALRIPRDSRGRVVARTADASGSDSADALGNALAASLFGGNGSGGSIGGPSPSPPDSLSQLRKAFASVGIYDGLNVRFGMRKTRHAYRDPAVVLTGSAKLVFRVSK